MLFPSRQTRESSPLIMGEWPIRLGNYPPRSLRLPAGWRLIRADQQSGKLRSSRGQVVVVTVANL